MTKKRKSIEYDSTISQSLENVENISVRDTYYISDDSSNSPSRRSFNIINDVENNRIRAYYDDEYYDEQHANRVIIAALDEIASRKKLGVTPILGVRARKKCESNKTARRVAAFRSGVAGKGKRTYPKKRYIC